MPSEDTKEEQSNYRSLEKEKDFVQTIQESYESEIKVLNQKLADQQKNEANGRTLNADNPNLKDNLHPEFDSPDVEDNETSGGYSNADNPNLQENIHSNFDNPNLNGNEFDSVTNPSLSQIEANNKLQKNKKAKKNRNLNLTNKVMTYGQVIDEEGQTRGKPAGEEPKEW